MPKKSNKKNDDDIITTKQTVKTALIVFPICIVVAITIWFGAEWFATEETISSTVMTINDKEYKVYLNQKVGGINRDYKNELEPNRILYAYFLELKDKSGQTSLSKVRFKSPVMNTQNAPVLITVGKNIWVVSTSNTDFRDDDGFILKFSVEGEELKQIDFPWDENNHIRQVQGARVYLSDGSRVFELNHDFFGGLYLDLATEKIVDDRKN